MYNAGDFDTTETVCIPFNAFTSDDPSASVTVTNLANTDVHIHKDGSLTQRSSASGVAVDIDVDGIAGNHWITIDLSDNTDAGFYAAGSRFVVRLEGITVDGATLNVFIGGFSVGCVLRPATAGRALNVAADGDIGGNVDGSVASVAGAVGSVTGAVGSVTGHTPQTADHAANISTLLSRLTALRAGYLDNLSAGAVALASALTAHDGKLDTVDGLVDTLIARLTAARAGYLDNLNIGENVAGTSEVTAVQNNTRCVRVVPGVIERPDSGTTTYRIELLLYDDVGNMEAPDSAPTIALVDQGGTDLSARLDNTTMTLVSTGRYRAIYTATSTDDLEQLVWAFSVVEGGSTRIYGNTSLIVDTTAADFTAADRAKLDTLHDTRIIGTLAAGTHQPQSGDAFARIGANGAGLTALAQAAVLGAPADAAADGDPTSADTVMAYIKQAINTLVGTAGIPIYPAAADPANGVSIAEVIRAIRDDVTGLNGDGMRGTDGANTTTPPTAVAIRTEVDTNSTQLAAIYGKVENLPESPKRNTATNHAITMVLAADHVTPATGLTVTGTVSKDGAAPGAMAGSVVEIGTTGQYYITFDAADLDGVVCTFLFDGGATADKYPLIVRTEP